MALYPHPRETSRMRIFVLILCALGCSAAPEELTASLEQESLIRCINATVNGESMPIWCAYDRNGDGDALDSVDQDSVDANRAYRDCMFVGIIVGRSTTTTSSPKQQPQQREQPAELGCELLVESSPAAESAGAGDPASRSQGSRRHQRLAL